MHCAFTLSPTPAPHRHHYRSPSACATEPLQPVSLSVCTGPTCSQAPYARSLAAALSALSPPNVSVHKVGCLGQCGTGPNVTVISRISPPYVQKGVQSAAAACSLLRAAGVEPHPDLARALQLQSEGDTLFYSGDAVAALSAFENASGALREWPTLHAAARSRAAATLLRLDRAPEALREANAAVDSAPGLPAAWRRKAEAHEACGQRRRAADAATVLATLALGQERDDAKRWAARLRRKWFWTR